MDIAAKPKMTLSFECRDKDGNLKWTDEVVIEEQPEKEQQHGDSSNDRRQER